MRTIILISILAISLMAQDGLQKVYKGLFGGLEAICKGGTDAEVIFYKGKRVVKSFKFKQEVDGGFGCNLYFSKDSNSFYALVEDGLERIDLNSSKRDLVVGYDGIGTLYGYTFNKDETKLLSWGGDYKQVVKLTNLKTLKSKVLTTIDINKIKKVIFSKDEKSVIIVNKDSTKRVVNLDK